MNSPHLIQKQFLEIEFDNPEDALGLQNMVADVFYTRIQPRIEELFEELFGKEYFISIDQLKINCGTLNLKNWEHELAESAVKMLKIELIQLNKTKIQFEEVESDLALDDFIFFLENGFFPWNARYNSLNSLENNIRINAEFLLRLNKSIQGSRAVERLVNQFSEKFICEIMVMEAINNSVQPDYIFQMRQKFIGLGKVKNKIDQAILQFLTGIPGLVEKSNNFQVEKAIAEIINLNSETTIDEKKQELTESNSTIYINNAGLVIFHPYISTLFEHLKVTFDNQWYDESSKYLAVGILEFLALGNDKLEEFNLPLNKILCGMKPEVIINLPGEIDETIRKECEDFLEQVIQHWKALKNTGKDGIREAFIQRRGSLTRINNGWLLKVETKSMDILLNQLPWSIGLVKFPWMDEILFVEWVH